MHLRNQIEAVFSALAFERPLFHAQPGGLRFALSEGGTVVDQFELALRKALAICADIFAAESALVVCLRFPLPATQRRLRRVLGELRSAGIGIPRQRELWVNADEGEEEPWINVAFEAPACLLQSFLWCALATDFPAIRPNPHCFVYLFEMHERIMVFPYDDRGMDVVGPNHELLSRLYFKHCQYVMECERSVMQDTFELSDPAFTARRPA